MNLHLDPQKGLSEVAFGTTREAVKETLGVISYSQKAVPWDESESDYFDKYGLRITYNNKGVVNIGLQSPAKVFLGSQKIIFGDSIKEIKKLLKHLNYGVSEYDGSIYSDDLGVCLAFESKKLASIEVYLGTYADVIASTKLLMDQYYDEKFGEV